MIQKAEHIPSLPWSTLQGKHALSRLNQGEEMRMSLWISNYNYPEKDQKHSRCCFKQWVKWQLQWSCFKVFSCLYMEGRFWSFLSPLRQISVTWNLFRRRVNFTLKELGSVIDSTYGTICHCIVSKCFFLSFFPPLQTDYFTTHCLEKKGVSYSHFLHLATIKSISVS